MAHFSCIGVSVRARGFGRWAVPVSAFVLALGCATTALLQAAPVTLRFEGTIGPPRDGTFPIDLPFSFSEGDPISGSFTFEPKDVPSDVERTQILQNTSL